LKIFFKLGLIGTLTGFPVLLCRSTFNLLAGEKDRIKIGQS
jgi:hypothetical protein